MLTAKKNKKFKRIKEKERERKMYSKEHINEFKMKERKTDREIK